MLVDEAEEAVPGTEASHPQVDAQLLTVQKLEEKERALQGSLGGVEKELTLRSQALELNKRKVRLGFGHSNLYDGSCVPFCLCLAMLPQMAQSEAWLCSWVAHNYCYCRFTMCQALYSVLSTLDSISFYCCVYPCCMCVSVYV